MAYKKYTAGNNLNKTLDIVKDFNKDNVACSISYLPVRKDDAADIHKEILEYYKLIDKVHSQKLNADVTLKLHQFGIYANPHLTQEAVTKIARYAHKNNVFVWVDMEMPETVHDTIAVFKAVHKKYKNTGIALQAYLRRTEGDMKDLLKNRVPIRLVKGFYVAKDFDTWKEVTNNYEHLMEYLLMHSDKPCIATHDLKLRTKAKEIIKKHKIKNAEIQMFNGARNELAKEEALEGYSVRIYIPYGHVFKFVVDGWRTFDMLRHIQRILGFKTIR